MGVGPDCRLRMRIQQYTIVTDNAGTNVAAYVPDLPGYVAMGEKLVRQEQFFRFRLRKLPDRNVGRA